MLTSGTSHKMSLQFLIFKVSYYRSGTRIYFQCFADWRSTCYGFLRLKTNSGKNVKRCWMGITLEAREWDKGCHSHGYICFLGACTIRGGGRWPAFPVKRKTLLSQHTHFLRFHVNRSTFHTKRRMQVRNNMRCVSIFRTLWISSHLFSAVRTNAD